MRAKIKYWNKNNSKGKGPKKGKVSKDSKTCPKCTKSCLTKYQKCLTCEHVQHINCTGEIDASSRQKYLEGRKPIACVECVSNPEKIEQFIALAISFKPQVMTENDQEETDDLELDEAPEEVEDEESSPNVNKENNDRLENMQKQIEILKVSLSSIQKEYSVLKDGKMSMEANLKRELEDSRENLRIATAKKIKK
jgi:hypothetical protein